MNKIWLSILLTGGFTLWGGPPAAASADLPLVQSADLDASSFLAFVRAEDRKSLAEFLEISRPRRENLEKLMQFTQRAQTLWLGGQTGEARVFFRQVSELALEDDWREAQREAIAYSRLRLAQSSPTASEQRDWLEKLAMYAPDYRPSADSFPPPLVAILDEAKALAKKNGAELALAERFPHYRFLIVNGRKYGLSPRKKIKIPGGTFRITALSDSNPPLSEKMTANELAQFRVLTSPLASGTCATPKVSEIAETPFETLYPQNCLGSSRKELALGLTPHTAATTWPTSEPIRPPLISKRTWWIIGGTVLVTGLAVTFQKLNEKKIEPTARQGF